MTRRRHARPGGTSWQDAHRNAPGAPVHAYVDGCRTAETVAILAWLTERSPQAFSTFEIHLQAIAPRFPLWTPGRTTSRLNTLWNRKIIEKLAGSLFKLAVIPAV